MRKLYFFIALVLLFAGTSANATEGKKKVKVDEASLSLGSNTQAYLASIFADEQVKVDQEKDTKPATNPTARKNSESDSKSK